jgi:hypothetical protein
MAAYKAIYKCKQCNEKILDEDVVFNNIEKAIKKIAGTVMTHTCENNSGSRKIGVLEHIGFWEKKLQS